MLIHMNQGSRPILLAITMAVPGGATSFVFSFARWLKAQGHSVVVAAGDEGTWLEERCKEAAIPFHRIPHLRRAINPFHDALALKSFIDLIREIKPSALHLNSSKAGVIGSLAGRLTQTKKIVYCIGGWAALDAKNAWQRAAYTWPERLSSSWKDIIVCLHPGDAVFAKEHKIIPRQSLEVIPNGVDIDQIRKDLLPRAEARQLLHLPRNGVVVGTIANFYLAKDLPRYVEACALALRDRPDLHFCLIGDGEERAQIEKQIQRYHLEKSITLSGVREHAMRFLSAFDVFVLPSKKEGMPFALLEAAAANLPIVTTDVGAHRWMLPEANIVPPERPAALAAAIIGAASDPKHISYAKSLSRFSEEACFAAHERLLVS